ncbi:ATP-dependent DNA helicase [Neptuniibacter sp. SY11_33]|uniref:ATP-dependent DNA helicase n=1 Tax=Neptuniibacter sp. SY11_33 TaxID=3398215 RepID=UPI0039F4A4F8
MLTVSSQIINANAAICQNIDLLAGQRDLLSLNILSQLRNLVEGVAVFLHTKDWNAAFTYPSVEPGLSYVGGDSKLSFLLKFHKLIQQTTSHFTMNGDGSERLMLKYYEYLHRMRSLLKEWFGIELLHNLENFPVDLDPSMREYHEKIAARIEESRYSSMDDCSKGRYYIHKTRPFFVGWHVYYEVTFCRAVNKVSKFDRIIAFTSIDMTDKYAAMLTLQRDSIDVIGQTMPIMVIREWEVSIRPCEFNNFSRLLGIDSEVRTNSAEYRFLMYWLTQGSGNLLDLMDMKNDAYEHVKRLASNDDVSKKQIFKALDRARGVISASAPGSNVLRYLMLRMYNLNLKMQFDYRGCGYLSNMLLSYGCIPFDKMPFCTSLPGHNPRFQDLIESLDASGRKHEILARSVKNNVERNGALYTALADVQELGDITALAYAYNKELYYRHTGRQLVIENGQVFIREYEDDTAAIVEKLQKFTSSNINGYAQAVERWLHETAHGIDDPEKQNSLKQLFSQSCVALVYGAAGTGKSTMVDHIAHYFNDKKKLFLAHTNPATDNLKRKVRSQNSEFRTIKSQIWNSADQEYDLLIIDECSTVSNADLIKVLEKTKFGLLVLVGDVYQIESIQFGNWFELMPSFLPQSAVFELTTPYRAKNPSLLDFWTKVRNLEDDIAESMVRNCYSRVLDRSLFEAIGHDEIILCLNYDGLYGINNINRFLQSSNLGRATTWREATYKVGDPVLFHDSERFSPVIYNNLKGWIVGIEHDVGWIKFDVKLDRPLSAFDVDVDGDELEWIEDSTVRFTVYDYDASDDDDDRLNITVPFQVAYAVSIHKAQGLEYDSVKVVITDANEDDITHSIFYTAITRARENLQVFWTPETQQRVLKRLQRGSNSKDVNLLAHRRGFQRV